MPDDLQLKIVASLDGKAVEEAKRQIEELVTKVDQANKVLLKSKQESHDLSVRLSKIWNEASSEDAGKKLKLIGESLNKAGQSASPEALKNLKIKQDTHDLTVKLSKLWNASTNEAESKKLQGIAESTKKTVESLDPQSISTVNEQTEKWGFSWRMVTANVKALKGELHTLPYFGQIFSVLRNPIVLLGAGIAAVIAKTRELTGAIRELLAPIQNAFGVSQLRNTHNLTASFGAAKTAVEEINSALERTLQLMAIAEGKGKMPLPGERKAIEGALRQQLGIAAAAGGQIGMGSGDIDQAASASAAADARLEKAVNTFRTGENRRALLSSLAGGAVGMVGWPKEMVSEVNAFQAANFPMSLEDVGGALLSRMPSELQQRRAVDSAQARSKSARAAFLRLAPDVATGKMSAAEFAQSRERSAIGTREAALGAAGTLQERLETLDINRSQAFKEAYKYEWGGPEFTAPNGAPGKAAAAATARASWSRAYSPSRGGTMPAEQGRIESEMRSAEARIAPLLFSALESDKSLLAEMATKLNQLREQLDTIKKQLRDGDFR